jgi:hypothetical protein
MAPSIEKSTTDLKTTVICVFHDILKSDSTQSASIHILKVFIFLNKFAESASVKIDVNKFFKINYMGDLNF